jgi:hypothetical protein
MEETFRHLHALWNEGIGEVVFTPHLLAADLPLPSLEAVLAFHQERFRDVAAKLADRNGKVKRGGLQE